VVRDRVGSTPKVALILGSGLGDFADILDVDAEVDSADIPHYPRSSVQGHAGRLIFGRVHNGSRASPPLLVFKGRVHFYETGLVEKVIFPVVLAKGLGVKTLVATNAAGGINSAFRSGDLMLIRDVLNL